MLYSLRITLFYASEKPLYSCPGSGLTFRSGFSWCIQRILYTLVFSYTVSEFSESFVSFYYPWQPLGYRTSVSVLCLGDDDRDYSCLLHIIYKNYFSKVAKSFSLLFLGSIDRRIIYGKFFNVLHTIYVLYTVKIVNFSIFCAVFL